jgi:hypothetical protein
MVDAVGTNNYAYTTGGLLWTESGPFSNGTVTNGYLNRKRVSLALQQPTGSWATAYNASAPSSLNNTPSVLAAFVILCASSRKSEDTVP